MKVNNSIKKETIITGMAFIAMILGFNLAAAGFEKFGKLVVLVSILTGITFIVIGNIKFWFGKKPQDDADYENDKSEL
ncbi:hypothetical protein DU490_08980 [Halomonas sp. DQ26W]|uniref:hypothetical protein n=1 Tax=Halomonas sp. DQ26W TaxID=2282311 RepID=UPI000DF81CAF|nr:hypothetical protein [Halomonas sp. DQ26W]RDB43278.1 hypothetical protein DU490_08980 [Halomonas sp. DQ26W]